jgi:energy-converting hydrogenase Eha subunit B
MGGSELIEAGVVPKANAWAGAHHTKTAGFGGDLGAQQATVLAYVQAVAAIDESTYWNFVASRLQAPFGVEQPCISCLAHRIAMWAAVSIHELRISQTFFYFHMIFLFVSICD